MSFLLSHFLFNKVREQEGGRGKVAQTMYTHLSKCKKDKIFKKLGMSFKTYLLEARHQ
jgi:hypothetical protein